MYLFSVDGMEFKFQSVLHKVSNTIDKNEVTFSFYNIYNMAKLIHLPVTHTYFFIYISKLLVTHESEYTVSTNLYHPFFLDSTIIT